MLPSISAEFSTSEIETNLVAQDISKGTANFFRTAQLDHKKEFWKTRPIFSFSKEAVI